MVGDFPNSSRGDSPSSNNNKGDSRNSNSFHSNRARRGDFPPSSRCRGDSHSNSRHKGKGFHSSKGDFPSNREEGSHSNRCKGGFPSRDSRGDFPNSKYSSNRDLHSLINLYLLSSGVHSSLKPRRLVAANSQVLRFSGEVAHSSQLVVVVALCLSSSGEHRCHPSRGLSLVGGSSSSRVPGLWGQEDLEECNNSKVSKVSSSEGNSNSHNSNNHSSNRSLIGVYVLASNNLSNSLSNLLGNISIGVGVLPE